MFLTVLPLLENNKSHIFLLSFSWVLLQNSCFLFGLDPLTETASSIVYLNFNFIIIYLAPLPQRLYQHQDFTYFFFQSFTHTTSFKVQFH